MSDIEVASYLPARDIPKWEECHLCGDTSLDGDNMCIEGEYAQQNIVCQGCGASWVEVYKADCRDGIEVPYPISTWVATLTVRNYDLLVFGRSEQHCRNLLHKELVNAWSMTSTDAWKLVADTMRAWEYAEGQVIAT